MIARLQAWAAAAVTGVVALLAAFGIGRLAGSRRAKDAAAQRVEQEQQRAAAAEREATDAKIRSEVESDVFRLPSGPVVPVRDASAGSARERLRDEWSLD